jgi:hypothetical protein
MDLKQALIKMKGARDKPFFFFFCEQGEDGKPVLLVDVKPIAPKEINLVLATAKKKNKAAGKMSINLAGELNVLPKGSAPNNLATGIQKAARNANAMVFSGVIIGPHEEEGEESEPQPAVPSPLAGAPAEEGRVPSAPPAPPPSASPAPIAPLLPGGKPADFVPVWAAAKIAWQAASDVVNGQITRLQRALRKSDDDELQQIGEFGLNAVTGNFKVPLMAAIRDVDGADGPALKAAAGKLLKIIDGFQRHIDSDEGIAACDDNPFGVSVTIKSTLGEAFHEMKQALATIT